MADAEGRGKVDNNHNLFTNDINLVSSFPVVINDGIDLISLLISAKVGYLPQKHPKALKDELSQKISQPLSIDSVNFTRQGQLILTTKKTSTAQEILSIDNLLGVPVNSFIQTETITSRFLLRLDCSVSCSDVATELTEQGFAIHEIRRFVKKSSGIDQPTPNVLVTCYGTSLPDEVKIWYQVHKIQTFYDKPRSCAKCHRYNHSTKACRSEPICKICATSHTGNCSSDTPCCINCKGQHAADDKKCPKYIQETKV